VNNLRRNILTEQEEVIQRSQCRKILRKFKEISAGCYGCYGVMEEGRNRNAFEVGMTTDIFKVHIYHNIYSQQENPHDLTDVEVETYQIFSEVLSFSHYQ
jgi:hypothetical protein